MSDLALTAESPSRSPLADEVARRRTFAIISHPDAGKTTLTEKLLLFGGAINLAGQVKAKGERRNTRSDWMKIERDRGISVVTSVMTFEFNDLVFNLLDTPGHEDFSEDTYRTLTAVDSAVMVIDAAKGIEARTLKLIEVCRLRDIPIITFINKMDRESRDTFDLLDEIEKTLALDTTPMTWPVGRGRDFLGTYDIATGGIRLLEGGGAKTGAAEKIDVAELAGAQCQSRRRRNHRRTGAGEGSLQAVRSGVVSRRPHDAGVFRLGAAQFRRRRSAGRPRQIRAAAARAGSQSAQGRGRRAAHERLRVQDPGQHGPEPPRPHRLRAAVLGQADARHEGEAGAHRQEHDAVVAAVLLRAGSRDGGRSLCRRRRRHSQSRHAADRRHADRRRGYHLRRRAESSRRKSCAACG